MIEQKFVDPASKQPYTLITHHSFSRVCFSAMSSRCELLIDSKDIFIVHTFAKMCLSEVNRIATKFSSFIPGSICQQINNSRGHSVKIDEESAKLLFLGEQGFSISNGLFDLTTGLLSKLWHHNDTTVTPNQKQIDQLLPYVGWDKISLSHNQVCVPKNMQLDFTAVAKGYAVESLCELAANYISGISVVVNLGGDIQVTKNRSDGSPWLISIDFSDDVIPLSSGALSSSYVYKRYTFHADKKYSHLINPSSGWPIESQYNVVTVHQSSCTQCSLSATSALLNGNKAINFLEKQGFQYWIDA